MNLPSIDEYISNPSNINLNDGLKNPKFYEGVLRFYKVSTPFFHTKISSLKKISAIATQEGMANPFNFKIDFNFKLVAYMKDSGEMHISLGLVIFRSFSTLLSVYLHELSHLWLSQQQCYPQLKALQRQFFENYSSETKGDIASPIEFYADLITVDILEGICAKTQNKRVIKAISKQIEARKNKREGAISELLKISSANR